MVCEECVRKLGKEPSSTSIIITRSIYNFMNMEIDTFENYNSRQKQTLFRSRIRWLSISGMKKGKISNKLVALVTHKPIFPLTDESIVFQNMFA